MRREFRSPRVSAGGSATASGLTFQARVGAFFGLCLLSQRPVDHALGLGNVFPSWMRFETEAPVDDILIATSAEGFIAIQAKTSLSLSATPTGEFAKTVQQFVRHWLVCRDGTGTQLWDRPLDPQLDRLVLAVGPNAPTSIRTDLPEALRLHIQPGSPALTQRQARALEVFEQCAEGAWEKTTTEPWTRTIVYDLARLVRVWTFDPNGADGRAMETIATAVAASGQSRALLTTLSHLCEQWMTERGGADLTRLRQALVQEHVGLATPPRYAEDIRALQEHSSEIADILERNESVAVGAGNIQIRRECQTAVLAAAKEGSLLIIGEPGSGKSAVINTLARELQQQGDVVELAVDRYNVNDLDGLRSELGLENRLDKVFEAWDGPSPGWLVIDALDATRGGKGEGAFRMLIERVLALKGRWKVVASIRTFDLHMGIRFRELFPGQPPAEPYQDPNFPTVRHVLVPPWSPTEFAKVRTQAPELGRALEAAPIKLQQLAEVPFNTRLIKELLESGVVAESLRDLANQAGLLRLYWDHRIADLGAAAEACLRRVVSGMVDARALRAPTALAADSHPASVDALCERGVLIRVENERYVQFRHHLLFDYVASRILLDLDRIISGRSRFPKSEGKGLMLAPALGFLLQELWTSDTSRDRYWTAVEQIVGENQGDPILRSVAGRLSAEFPEVAADTQVLARHMESGHARAVATLGHATAALAVRLEDALDVQLAPWVALAGELAGSVRAISLVLRFLVHLLLNMANPPQVCNEVGLAARALLSDAFDHEEPQQQAASLISFVVATFATDPVASRTLLNTVFDPRRFEVHGWEEVPALCREIGKLAPTDPGFAAQVYAKAYAGSADSDVVTRMGNSRIVSFTSNAHQDYSLALYSLSQFFPEFLTSHPVEAAEALVNATEAYIARAHPPRQDEKRDLITRALNDRTVHLKPDMSYIWAHDPGAQYALDGEALIGKFVTTLVDLPEEDALFIAEELAARAASAIIWSRLFLAAVRRGDRLIDYLWPIASIEDWLVQPDTRKDAIDLVAAGYAKRTDAEREALERSALNFDLSEFTDPPTAKQALLKRLFGAIGAMQLVTEEALSYLAQVPANTYQSNERLFSVSTSSRHVGPFDWIHELDRSQPSNATMMTAIEEAQAYFGLKPSQAAKPEIEAWQGLSVLESVAKVLSTPGLNPDLRHLGEGVIGEGCVRLATDQHLEVKADEADPTEQFLALLRIPSLSDEPSVDDDTEARFEDSQAWNSPAPRLEAAVAILDVCLQRPDLYTTLKGDIDRLLDDAHPATRLQVARHLVRIWDIDRPGFWSRLAIRLSCESNFGVLGGVIDLLRRVLHADSTQTEVQLFAVLNRFDGTADEGRLAELTADLLAILAVKYSSPEAKAIIYRWISEPILRKEPLGKVLVTLRGAVALGLRTGETEDSAARHRAQALFHRIVLAANGPLNGFDSKAVIPDDQVEALRACVELLNISARELYFATGRANGGTGGLSDAGCATFLEEIAPTIERIGDNAPPQIVQHLMELIEVLAPYGPAKAFDLTAHVIRSGGSQSGYQYESLGAELLVRLVGAFLADDKEIFEDEARRQALVDCLEIFMEAGWTAARRLLYRLPELIQ